MTEKGIRVGATDQGQVRFQASDGEAKVEFDMDPSEGFRVASYIQSESAEANRILEQREIQK